jgi:phosphoribosylamine--glycine ligase
MNILVIGSGARENAIVKSLLKSNQKPQVFCFGSSRNPDILQKSTGYAVGKMDDLIGMVEYAKIIQADLVIVGPDNPIADGATNLLQNAGFEVASPTKAMSEIEWSKSFTRNLLAKYGIEGSPLYKSFAEVEGVREYIESSIKGEFVIKADGLCGGKGVKVQGDHFQTIEEGIEICKDIVESGDTFLIEQKLVGQEFSLFTFSDGKNLVDMPLVQDHKRAFNGDKGPNTGGMGTYSDSNHLLPFLTQEDKDEASNITIQVADALREEIGEGYKGVFYGGFMKTKNGIKLIEYNARFGDPEAMNILELLESDFVKINKAIVSGTLHQTEIKFSKMATVCKYLVPMGYPDHPVKGEVIDISELDSSEGVYFASVDVTEDNKLVEIGSRTIAICAKANTIYEAEKIVESQIQKIKGPLFHRSDMPRSRCSQVFLTSIRTEIA